jgi:hypothetical protein
MGGSATVADEDVSMWALLCIRGLFFVTDNDVRIVDDCCVEADQLFRLMVIVEDSHALGSE